MYVHYAPDELEISITDALDGVASVQLTGWVAVARDEAPPFQLMALCVVIGIVSFAA
jgi:hypothetical protein